MRPVRLALATTIAVVSLTACSSSSDSDDSAETAETSTSSPDETTSSAATDEPSESTSGSDAAPVTGSGYSVAMPAGWQDVLDAAKKTNAAVDVAIAEPARSGEFRTNFNVVQPNPLPEGVSDKELAAQAARELRSVTQTKVTPIDGVDFDGSAALGQTASASASGFDVTLVQYIVVHDDQIYATTLTFETKRGDEARAAFVDIVSSWTWDDA